MSKVAILIDSPVVVSHTEKELEPKTFDLHTPEGDFIATISYKYYDGLYMKTEG